MVLERAAQVERGAEVVRVGVGGRAALLAVRTVAAARLHPVDAVPTPVVCNSKRGSAQRGMGCATNHFFEFQFFKKSRDEKRRRTLRDPQPADVSLGRLPTDQPAHTDILV